MYRMHFLRCIVYCMPCIELFSIQCTLYNELLYVQCNEYTFMCTVYTARCTVYSVLCTICTIYYVLFTEYYTAITMGVYTFFNVQYTVH